MPGSPRILVVAPLPPPVNGQSVVSGSVVELLGDEALAISLTPARVKSRLRRAAFFLLVLARLLVIRFSRGITHVYFTCSRSGLGGLRDVVLVAMFHSRRYRIINHVHGGDVPYYVRNLPAWWRPVVRALYRRIDVAVALTDSMARDLANYFPQVQVIQNSYPVEAHACEWEGVRASKTARVGPATPLRVVLLSTLMYSKGVLVLLEAVRRLNARGIPVRLEVIGGFEGDRYHTLDQIRTAVRARAHELRAFVTLHGHISDMASKLEYLRRADVFCLPTFYRSEGAPLSVIDAMSLGCAVVATSAGYLDEIVPETVGWRLAEASEAAVAEALARAASDDAARRAKQAAAYLHARANLSPQHFAREIHRLFDRPRDPPT